MERDERKERDETEERAETEEMDETEKRDESEERDEMEETDPRLPVLRLPCPNLSKAEDDTLGCRRFWFCDI